MICDAQMRKAILTGKKRQHRIPPSMRTRKHGAGEYLPIRKLETVFDYGRNIETTPTVCYVEILDAAIERVDEITDEGAQAEGFDDRDAFLEAWNEAHPRTPECWCLTWRVSEDIRIPAITGRGDEHGYTRTHGSSLERELSESMATQEQTEAWGKEAREGLAADQHEVWEQEREVMVAALERCEAAGLEGRELWIIRRRIEAQDRKLARQAA